MINLFFLQPWYGNGVAAYTAHLYRSFVDQSADVRIYKVREQSETFLRPFGKYHEVYYRNISVEDALQYARDFESIIVAPATPNYLPDPKLIEKLIKAGAWPTIHEPRQVGSAYTEEQVKGRNISIRYRLAKSFGGTFIPHPYVRQGLTQPKRKAGACCITRIAPEKRPLILFDANRKLPKEKRIDIIGTGFRLYTKGLEEKHGDIFKQGPNRIQPDFTSSLEALLPYKYSVDMTFFAGDGGGTQYVQLESADAGTVSVMHEDWFQKRLAPKHVIPVNGPEELAHVVASRRDVTDQITAGYRMLREHEPKKIVSQYLEVLK